MEDKCLMFGGVELDNDQTLDECGIEHDDLLSLEFFGKILFVWCVAVADQVSIFNGINFDLY